MPRPNECEACGAHIMWRHHVRTGSLAPVESHPRPDGNVVLEGDRYRVLTKDELARLDGAPGMFDPPPPTRYVLHFATCPRASHFRSCRNCHHTPCTCGSKT